MSNGYFEFLNDPQTGERPDYLSLIEDDRARRKVANFFESSVTELIPHEKLMNLVEAINEDIYEGVCHKPGYFCGLVCHPLRFPRGCVLDFYKRRGQGKGA